MKKIFIVICVLMFFVEDGHTESVGDYYVTANSLNERPYPGYGKILRRRETDIAKASGDGIRGSTETK